MWYQMERKVSRKWKQEISVKYSRKLKENKGGWGSPFAMQVGGH